MRHSRLYEYPRTDARERLLCRAENNNNNDDNDDDDTARNLWKCYFSRHLSMFWRMLTSPSKPLVRR